MVIRDVCPRCKSLRYKKNGHIHNEKQTHHCHDCGRQFVRRCEQYLIAEEKRTLIERLLVERISLRGICRAVGVKLKWLLGFLVQCIETLPDHLHVQPVVCHGNVMLRRLEVEADELASFVQKKANKQWVWIAMDATTRQIIAFHVTLLVNWPKPSWPVYNVPPVLAILMPSRIIAALQGGEYDLAPTPAPIGS
jgi:insertion element IS1 protein InsB